MSSSADLATMELVKEAPRQTIKRSLDEPKLQIGDTISVREGIVGVVLARYIPSAEQNQIYIVELLSNGSEKGTP